jgi:hypothetical protein
MDRHDRPSLRDFHPDFFGQRFHGLFRLFC